MQNWHKYRNYRKIQNSDSSYTYIITVDGENVEVSEAIYIAYAKGGRKMEYMERDLKRDRTLQDENGKAVMCKNGLPIILPEREVSLDKLVHEDWEFSSSAPSPEDAAMKQFEMDELHHCLGLLDANERELINALFFDGLTIREYAALTGRGKSSIDRHKIKILGKLKKILAD